MSGAGGTIPDPSIQLGSSEPPDLSVSVLAKLKTPATHALSFGLVAPT